MTIPIIGQTRSWKTLQFGFQPILKPPVIASPHTQPEVVGWQCGFLAMRSDDLPVQSSCTIDVAKVTRDPIGSVLGVMQQMLVNLESFRTCACVPGASCPAHTAAVKES